MGQFKRTIRGWKDDIQNIWGKLKTFHRIASAIALAMVMIYVARVNLLDPLQAELTKKHKDMDQKGIPLVVLLAQEDPEIQESQLKLESLNASTPKWQRQMEKAISQRPQIDQTNRSDVLSEFELLFGKSGLVLRNRSEPDANETSGSIADTRKIAKGAKKDTDEAKRKKLPLKVLTYQYELAGTFQSVCNFLKHLGTFSYPARLCDIEIAVAKNKISQAGLRDGEPLIYLYFRLELYYHGK